MVATERVAVKVGGGGGGGGGGGPKKAGSTLRAWAMLLWSFLAGAGWADLA